MSSSCVNNEFEIYSKFTYNDNNSNNNDTLNVNGFVNTQGKGIYITFGNPKHVAR